MAKTDNRTADEYIATFPDGVQHVLRTVRQTILEAVPVQLIGDMARFRANENVETEKGKRKK